MRENSKFRWAKIYDEWTVVEIVWPNPDSPFGPEFYCIGDDELCTVDDFKGSGSGFQWGDEIKPPEETNG